MIDPITGSSNGANDQLRDFTAAQQLTPREKGEASPNLPFIQPYEKSKSLKWSATTECFGVVQSNGAKTNSEAEGRKNSEWNLFHIKYLNQVFERGYERAVPTAQKVEISRRENGASFGIVTIGGDLS